jgi:hypothetical protein
MVKVSITLPNNAQITFESEEPEVIHEIVGMVLRDLPRDLMQTPGPVNGNGGRPGEPANGKTAAIVRIDPPEEQPPDPPAYGERSAGGGVRKAPRAGRTSKAFPKILNETTTTPPVLQSAVSTPTGAGPAATDPEAGFTEFCRISNPLGDMRRVVVAAEGARRFLGAESVDAEGLVRLFVLAGWARPHSFVQTLRNAARSKFRWLERVPGRSGFYTVTDLGRSTALGG